jgi:hypothetical protein
MTDYEAARAEVERLISWPGADEEPDDNIRIVRVGHIRALLAGPPEPMASEPVAWRYRSAPHRPWWITNSAAIASDEADLGSEVQALYRSKTND